MQSLWLLKVDWDIPLPEDVVKKRFVWSGQLEYLLKLKILRWSQYLPNAKAEPNSLGVTFYYAYSADLYLRVVTDS